MGNAEQRTIRLVIAHEHQVIREGLRSMLIGSHEIELVGSATNVHEAIRLVGELQPDVLLIDPHPHNQNGLQAIELIRGEWPQVAIVAFTIHQHEDHILRALRVGVCAYLTLHTERAILRHAIHTAAKGQTLLQPEHVACLLGSTKAPLTSRDELINMRGKLVSADDKREEIEPASDRKEESKLTEREREVLCGVAHGERNKEIAARLGISEPTVKSHLASIYFKLRVDSRASAVAVAIQRGILSLRKSHL